MNVGGWDSGFVPGGKRAVFRNGTPNPSSAFTLAEMAIVMVVMGLVVLTVLPALNAVRSANQVALTQSNLRSLMLATAAFAQANGCLPCPAIPNDTLTNFGEMGYESTTISCGACVQPQGIPPFVALGLPPSVARDGWGHWITMRVDPGLTTLPTNSANCASNGTCSSFVPPQSACTAKDNANAGFCLANPVNGVPATAEQTISYATKGLCRYNLSSATGAIPIKVTTTKGGPEQKAAVIFISHGSTGYGSFIAAPGDSGCMPFPPGSYYPPCNGTAGFAQCNAAVSEYDACTPSASAHFYDMPIVASGTDLYDDILAYADRNTLVSMLGNGACNTTW